MPICRRPRRQPRPRNEGPYWHSRSCTQGPPPPAQYSASEARQNALSAYARSQGSLYHNVQPSSFGSGLCHPPATLDGPIIRAHTPSPDTQTRIHAPSRPHSSLRELQSERASICRPANRAGFEGRQMTRLSVGHFGRFSWPTQFYKVVPFRWNVSTQADRWRSGMLFATFGPAHPERVRGLAAFRRRSIDAEPAAA